MRHGRNLLTVLLHRLAHVGTTHSGRACAHRRSADSSGCKRGQTSYAVVPGVKWIHDLHIWTMTFGLDALSALVAVPVRGGYMS
jgi:Co/Zn/Cd efflux system component